MAITDNGTQHLDAIEAFLAKARNVGVYSAPQATNLRFALGLALQTATAKGLDLDATTIAEFKQQVPALLDEYGGNNPASAGTIRTYKARALRLLRDFEERNGGDFMQWKADQARKATSPRKRPKPAKPAPNSASQDSTPPLGDTSATREHELRATGGRLARLVLPEPVTKRDLEVIWTQLEKLKPYLESQVDVDATDDFDEEGEK